MTLKQLEKKYEKALKVGFIDPIVEAVVADRVDRTFESDLHYAERIREQLLQGHQGFQENIQNGLRYLKQRGVWIDKERVAALEALFKKPMETQAKAVCSQYLQDLIGITNEELTQCYTEGFQAFSEDDFQTARDVFLLLTQLNPQMGAFWSALGSAEEKLGDLTNACYAFIIGAELDTKSLLSYQFAANCEVLLGRTKQAKTILMRALERVHEEPALKKQAKPIESMLKTLN